MQNLMCLLKYNLVVIEIVLPVNNYSSECAININDYNNKYNFERNKTVSIYV